MVIISDCLKKLRTENNLTQMQLAKAFGLRPSTISAYQVRKMIDVSDLSDEELESIKVLLEEYRKK